MSGSPLPSHGIEFLESIRSERGLAANTAAAYRRDLIQYRATLDDNSALSGAQVVHEHLALLRDRGLKDTSIARKFACIRAYHRFLVAEGYALRDPTAMIDAPARAIPLPRALTIEEVSKLLDAPETHDKLGRRDRAVLELLYATGCRATELVDIDIHDIDFETKTAIVTGKGNRQRLVPFGSYAAEAINAWLPDRLELRGAAPDLDALFLTARGNRLSRQTVWRIVARHGRTAGISPDRLSPHVLRHSAATHMVEGGADLRTVQEMLGHASLSTTQVYTKVSPEHLREVVVVHHPRGR